MNQKLGVCIIGCGYMGGIHAASWATIPEVALVAVCDIDESRADKLAAQYKLDTFYTDYLEAIALPEVDIVSVCIPTVLHRDVTVAAAALGKHVLCEKPAALTLAQMDEMMAAATENNIKLGIGFMRRHSPVVADLKARLAAGEFGRPVLYHASDVRELRPKREMHDAQVNGGPVIDMAVHLIDLWINIFDSRPVSVTAQGLRIGQDRPEISHIQAVAIDTASILVKFESGDIGTFVVTWGLPSKVNPNQVKDQIYGPNGLGEVYYQGSQQELQIMKAGGFWETLSIAHTNMYQQQAADFVRWVLTDQPFPATGEAGKASLVAALAALESIQTGQTIQLI